MAIARNPATVGPSVRRLLALTRVNERRQWSTGNAMPGWLPSCRLARQAGSAASDSRRRLSRPARHDTAQIRAGHHRRFRRCSRDCRVTASSTPPDSRRRFGNENRNRRCGEVGKKSHSSKWHGGSWLAILRLVRRRMGKSDCHESRRRNSLPVGRYRWL